MNFGFRPPYNVLLDGNFIQECVKVQFDVKEMLMKLLFDPVHIIFTRCAYEELKSLKSRLKPGTFEAAQSFKREMCTHNDLPASECIKRYVGDRNFRRAFVASQDVALRTELRQIPSVPLIYFAHNIMTLDEPTDLTLEKSERKEDLKLKPEDIERKHIKQLLKEVKEERKQEEKAALEELKKDKDNNKLKAIFKGRKKAKGPNPLSVKRKRRAGSSLEGGEGKRTRRKRRKVADP